MALSDSVYMPAISKTGSAACIGYRMNRVLNTTIGDPDARKNNGLDFMEAIS